MIKLLKSLLVALLVPVCSYAAGWEEEEYKRIEQSIQQPKMSEKVYAITSYGAKTTASAAQNQLTCIQERRQGGDSCWNMEHWSHRIEIGSQSRYRRGCYTPLCLRAKALSIGSHFLGRLGLLELLSMHLCLPG